MQKRDLHNAVFNIAGESLWGLQGGLITSATVLVVILRHFGAGAAMIGSITSIETCALLFPQIVGLYLFRSRARRKAEIITYHYIAIIPPFFLIAWILHASPYLSLATVRAAVLACWGLEFITSGIVTAVWMDWIAGLFGRRFRGSVMGVSFCASSILGTAGGLFSGWVISHGNSAHTFSSLYVWAGVIATASITTFWFIDDPGSDVNGSLPHPKLSLILGNFRESLADRDFRAFLVGRILASSGFCILPLVGNYFSSAHGGAIEPGTLVRCGTAIAVGTALAELWLGRLGDRFGHRVGLICGIGAQVAALAILLLMHGVPACLLVYFLAGNMVFETCPHENRGAHITLANLVIGGFTALTPIVAGVAAAHWGSHAVFAASLLLSVCALAWFLLRVREPRKRNSGRLAKIASYD
jgi:MFS family permease